MDGRIARVYFHLRGPGDKIKEKVKAGKCVSWYLSPTDCKFE